MPTLARIGPRKLEQGIRSRSPKWVAETNCRANTHHFPESALAGSWELNPGIVICDSILTARWNSCPGDFEFCIFEIYLRGREMENCHSLIHSSQATASPQCVVGIQTLHCQGPHQQEAGIRKWNWASNQGTLTGTWHPSGIPTAMLTASPGIRYFLYNQNLVFSVLAIRISKVRFIFYFWYKIKIKLL